MPAEAPPPGRLLAAAAANVVLHVVGLALALWGMRPGTAAFSLDERMGYLASHPLGWSLGWGTWMLCALALVAFFAALQPWAPDPDLALLALALAAAGAGVDLLCDVGQIVVLPDLAAWTPRDAALFVASERGLGAGGTVVANGLYSLAVLLAGFALRARLPVSALALAAATCGAGLLMVVAGFSGQPRLVELSTGPTIAGFLLWTVVTSRGLSRRDRR